jgi:hypothetical protein
VISATQTFVSWTVAISTTTTISGTVSPAAGAAGITITLSGATDATTNVDVNGNYNFTVIANGTYTVTPSKSLYSFSPVSTPISVSNANVGSTAQTQAALSAAGGDVSKTSDAVVLGQYCPKRWWRQRLYNCQPAKFSVYNSCRPASETDQFGATLTSVLNVYNPATCPPPFNAQRALSTRAVPVRT